MGYIKCEAGYVEETGGISTIIVKSAPLPPAPALPLSPARTRLLPTLLPPSWRPRGNLAAPPDVCRTRQL